MNDVGLVCSLQCLGDLRGDLKEVIHRDRPLVCPLGKRGPFDQFENEGRLSPGSSNP